MTPKLCCVALLTILCGCSNAPSEPDSRVIELFGGDAAFQAAFSPSKVEAFRITFDDTDDSWFVLADAAAKVKRLGDLPRVSEVVSVDVELGRQIGQACTDARTYPFEKFGDKRYAKGCRPAPGVAIRFTGKDQTIDVLLCFSCGMLNILGKEPSGWKHCDPGKQRLVNLVKQVFLDDAEIQELDQPVQP